MLTQLLISVCNIQPLKRVSVTCTGYFPLLQRCLQLCIAKEHGWSRGPDNDIAPKKLESTSCLVLCWQNEGFLSRSVIFWKYLNTSLPSQISSCLPVTAIIRNCRGAEPHPAVVCGSWQITLAAQIKTVWALPKSTTWAVCCLERAATHRWGQVCLLPKRVLWTALVVAFFCAQSICFYWRRRRRKLYTPQASNLTRSQLSNKKHLCVKNYSGWCAIDKRPYPFHCHPTCWAVLTPATM